MRARATAALVLVVALTSSAAAINTARQPKGLSAEALVAAMNRERVAHGLGTLKLNAKLTLAAEDRMRDMLAKRYFEHISPDGIDPFSWVDKRGYNYTSVGENLAVGYHEAQSVVDSWMHSPAHRENVLKVEFEDMGIAIDRRSPVSRFAGPTIVAIYGTRH